MADGTLSVLSDNAVVAVLQATQLDHERRITENAAATTKNRELYEQRFEQMRVELHQRDDNLYKKINEVGLRSDAKLDSLDQKLDKNKESLDTKIENNAVSAASSVRTLQYWIMGAVGALVLNLLGVIFFLATRTPAVH